jgi:hypothetical protein
MWSGCISGEVIGQIHRRHRATEFKKFLTRLDKEVPAELADEILERLASYLKRIPGAGH